MEGAARIFAGEFKEATLTVPAGDTGSPAWVVTPGGAWCRLLYLCGVLTEVTEVADVLYCRLADPTGAFDLVAGGRRGAIAEQIRAIPVPSFVTVTGTAQGYRKNGGVVVSVRVEHVHMVDKNVRNRWIVATADMTMTRLDRLLTVLEGRMADERAETVIRHYGTSREKLRAMTGMIGSALAGVPREPGPAPASAPDICGAIMEIIRAGSGLKGVSVQDVIEKAALLGHSQAAVLSAIETLVTNDDCYQPQKGYVKPL
ncbi:hypothetical protein [Methanoregula sp.]|uniref:hypothetical protein n=1 Tax=Methanoregula sp. TaxID=2052170 RepID=UPI002C8D182F|nr:hypothetical protein [Methanoregula sp.]HVP96712.1 hypothetical protein [Methanoregula sp.]